ncbi:MAG: DEAD/DEAH box helicase [Clostridia bacterium]|jgi:DNA repair protein RadD|nr:DEAD/DEAH box helicase [Clostridia bacterium]
MITLREYQQEAVNAFFNGVRSGQKSGIICAPTGSGKSAIMAAICKTMQETYPSTKILIATHAYELIEQDAKTLKNYFPNADIGLYSAGLNQKSVNNKVIFAGIQSAFRHSFEFGKIDLLIVDESHRINQKETTQYGKFIKNLKVANPNLVILGLSATPYRMKEGLQYEGEDPLFDGLYYDISVIDLIKQGYLCPVISKGGIDQIDLTNVHITAGDYNIKELESAANKPELTKTAVNEIIEYSKSRKSVLIFTTGINHAKNVCAEIKSRGYECRTITGKTPAGEREKILTDYKNEKFKFLTNVNVLTTGFDNPKIDVIALLISTKSCAKYVQMVGRGMRLAPNKTDCLLLDFGSNVIRHGCIDEIIPPHKKLKSSPGDAPVRECPTCHTISHISINICPECGFVFPKKDPHDSHAYEGAVISTDREWLDVEEINYTRHMKTGKPDSVRIDFYTNKRTKPYPFWLLLEYPGYPKERARKYIRMCKGKAITTDDALNEAPQWLQPKRIEIKKNKETGFYEILSFDMPEETEIERPQTLMSFGL